MLGMILKLGDILGTIWGWVLALLLFLADYIAGQEFTIKLVVIITLMDAIWGIAVSVSRGKFTLSELMRLTIQKLVVYGCVLIAFIGLDKYMDSTITTSAIGAAIVLIELWSSCASMLILFPHILFLRLLKKALKGEIARKLGVDPEEVDNVLTDNLNTKENGADDSDKENGGL